MYLEDAPFVVRVLIHSQVLVLARFQFFCARIDPSDQSFELRVERGTDEGRGKQRQCAVEFACARLVDRAITFGCTAMVIGASSSLDSSCSCFRLKVLFAKSML